MKKIYILALVFGFMFSCNSYKKAQKNIYSGNFDQALDGMIKKYKKDNISEKDASRWVGIFNEAYIKAKSQNKDAIYSAQLMVESVEKHRIILDNYLKMQTRIDKLKPYMPFYVKGQEIVMDHSSYYIEIEQGKMQLANALYIEAEQFMATRDKMNARMAYDRYTEIAQLVPSYTSIKSKIDQSYQMGLSHTLVSINNDSRAILPRFFHRDLTNFNAFGVESFWNILHTEPSAMNYDYYLELNFRDIIVHPESISKKTFEVKKEISSNDTSRNARQRTITCKVTETRLYKDASINSEIILFNNQKQPIYRESPIVSSYVFDYKWAEYQGDKDALDSKYKKEMKCVAVSIPSHEAMLMDCAKDLKDKFKYFINRNVSNI